MWIVGSVIGAVITGNGNTSSGSGVTTGATLEAQARLAADVAEKQRLSPREATHTVLRAMQISDEAASLRDCGGSIDGEG